MIALEPESQNRRGFGDLRTITFVQFMCFAAGAIISAFPHDLVPMQTSSHPTQTHASDEISLFDLWRILVKRKALILICIVVCLAGGAVLAYLKAPVFEASIKLRIGQVKGSEGLLEPADELSARLLAQYGQNIAEGISRPRPFLTTASVQKGATTTLQLTAEGDTPEDAAGLLRDVVTAVQKSHADIFENSIRPITERLNSLNEQRETLRQQYADITQLVEKLKERETVQASLIMLERGPITRTINEQDAERLVLSQQLNPPQTRRTELLGEIAEPARPARPKKAMILALAAMLGVMGGVMLAFAAEFIASAKTRT